MKILKSFILLVYFLLAAPFPIELESYSELELNKGLSEYIYKYSNSSSYKDIIPYIYIKLSNYEKTDLKVYLNEDEAYYYLTKKDEWINIPIKEQEEINITIKIKTQERNIKFIFIDSSKIIEISLVKLLNLNFSINKLHKEPVPLYFNVSVDTNIYFSVANDEDSTDLFLDHDYDNYIFNYILKLNNFFQGAKHFYLMKDKTYRFKLNCYYKGGGVYYFKKIKTDYFIEEVYIKNNTFKMHNFTQNNYIFLNIQNYSELYFYIKDNSGFYHESYEMFTLSIEDLINIKKNENSIKEMKYDKVINGKINYVNNTKKSKYLIIMLNYKDNKKYHGFISFFTEKYEINEQKWFKEINKGIHALIYINKNYYSTSILSSSNKNIKLLYDSQNNFTNRIILNEEKDNIIYIDSSQESSKLYCNIFNNKKNDNNKYNYNFLTDKDINNPFNKINSDRFFIRKITNNMESGFYSYYFFDIQEEYYIYTKKYFGKINLFNNKKHLDLSTPIQDFMKPITYYDENIYKIVNNKLLILSGSQFFNYYINSGSFFDLFIQKVNDNNLIEINKDINKYSKNTVKMLNKKKVYNINFELNHLVKLDNNFLDTEIIFYNKEGIKYVLNDINKIIYLKGNNYIVKSNKETLIYFYEKIINYNNKSIIEFDKTQNGKNMQINITNNGKKSLKIAIVKDFCFKEYYPLMNYDDLEIITIPSKKMITLYIENYYDLLESDIYESEGEKYFIYLFEIKQNNELILLDNSNIEISSPLYFDSITKFSKFNYEIIPEGNNNLLLKLSPQFDTINYQFIKCSNNDITFNLKYIDNNLNNNEKHIINTNTIIKNNIDKNESLLYLFESKNEFLFLYDFSNNTNKEKTKLSRSENYGIKYLNINNKNILYIGFHPVYTSFSEFYIIIAKKNDINNLYSFSNPCYLTKLIMNNSNDIYIKKVYYSDEIFILEKINMNKIKQNSNTNDEYVINIISINLIQFNHFDIYNPVIINEKINNKNGLTLKLFDNIVFKPENDIFIYEHLTEERLKLFINLYNLNYEFDYNNIILILRENNENIKFFYDYKCLFEIVLEKKGIYYLEFIDINKKINNEYISLGCYSFNKMIDEIDLSKNYYYGFLHIYTNYQYEINDLSYYKVTNIKKDTEIYFADQKDYFGTYPFTVCKNKFDECQKNINSYTFLKGVNYTIYIYLININYGRIKYTYSYTYSFFPIFEITTLNMKKYGYYNFNSPTIFNFEKNEFYVFETFNIIPNFFSEECSKKWFFGNNYCYDFNGLKKCYYDLSFYEEEYNKCKSIIFVPQNNNKLMQLFISQSNLYNEQIKIKAGTNTLYKLENHNFDSDLSCLLTFSSPVENLRFISFDKNTENKKKKFIFNHYSRDNNYLFIDKSDKDIIINQIFYETKYIFLSILNDETIENFKSILDSYNICINCRFNTDNIELHDLINLYIDKFDVKYNLYIKKYYGQIKLYESQYELNDIENNIDILTKPINNLENKKSIFNRLIQLNKNQLINGYVSTNSLIDIYLEQDNNNKDIYLSEFKNRKYLKKGIEYHFHFYLNHLIKLESQFNAEIIIYNEDNKIILNNEIQTGIIIGNNYRMKSKEDVMVYFYPKTQKFQKRITPQKGQIIEIKKNGAFRYYIDFGFEGFESPNMNYLYNEYKLYIENIYDKLEVKLTQGEYLYIYYDSLREDDIEINYLNNYIMNSAYKYNFFLLKKNMSQYTFIISNTNEKTYKFKINQYESKSKFKLKIIDGKKITEHCSNDLELYNNQVIQFLFESENDLLFSYTYDDKYEQKPKNRKKLNNLIINDITLINNNKMKINFIPSYLNSLTKYIIIITPEEKNNTFENMKNYFYLVDLIYQKEGNFITEDYYDISEKNFSEIIIDISKIRNNYKKYIVNIISQEVKFDKKLKFYEPKIFYKEKNIVVIISKIVFLIVVISLLSILIYKYFKKSHRKINIKQEKLKRFNEDFGEEMINN